MMRLLGLAIAVLLSACAGVPTSPSEQGQWYAKFAKSEFEKGNLENGAEKFEYAATKPGGVDHVRQVFSEAPTIRAAYLAQMRKLIATLRSPYHVIEFRRRLNSVSSSGMLSATEVADLNSALSKSIVLANERDDIQFLIDGDFSQFPELADEKQSAVAFERTLEIFQMERGARDFTPLLAYATRNGSPSTESRRIAAMLPKFKVRAVELDALQSLYPEFVAQRRAEITAKVFLAVRNADRLFADDLQNELRRSVKGVVWLAAPEPGAIHLTIEKVRSDEQVIPEKTETVTYSQSDVDFFSAALLMPKNASYLYELVTGGFALDYGYVVTARAGQEPAFEGVVRGKVESNYRKCQNARIQNVFGGVARAEFVANDNMKQRCAGPESASMDNLRQQVLEKITSQVLEAPRIKGVHSAN